MCPLEVGKSLKIKSFLKIPLTAFLFRIFVIIMFPCGILSTFKVAQSSSRLKTKILARVKSKIKQNIFFEDINDYIIS